MRERISIGLALAFIVLAIPAEVVFLMLAGGELPPVVTAAVVMALLFGMISAVGVIAPMDIPEPDPDL